MSFRQLEMNYLTYRQQCVRYCILVVPLQIALLSSGDVCFNHRTLMLVSFLFDFSCSLNSGYPEYVFISEHKAYTLRLQGTTFKNGHRTSKASNPFAYVSFPCQMSQPVSK